MVAMYEIINPLFLFCQTECQLINKWCLSLWGIYMLGFIWFLGTLLRRFRWIIYLYGVWQPSHKLFYSSQLFQGVGEILPFPSYQHLSLTTILAMPLSRWLLLDPLLRARSLFSVLLNVLTLHQNTAIFQWLIS